MNAIRAVVREGRLEVRVPDDWADGTEVILQPAAGNGSEQDPNGSPTREQVAAALARIESHEGTDPASGAKAPEQVVRWLQQALGPLFRLRDLPPGWDTYGSPPIPDDVILGAVRLLFHAAAEQSPWPHLAPVSGGGVQLEWAVNGRELEIEIFPDGSVAYLKARGEEMDDGPLDPYDAGAVRTLVRWVVHG